MRMLKNMLDTMVLLVISANLAESLFLPEKAPELFCKEEESGTNNCKADVEVYVNQLNSNKNIIPYEYSSFDFCEKKRNFNWRKDRQADKQTSRQAILADSSC